MRVFAVCLEAVDCEQRFQVGFGKKGCSMRYHNLPYNKPYNNPLYRNRRSIVLTLLFLVRATFSLFAASDCLSIGQAAKHVGETKCITGKVLHVKAGAKGTHFIGFCAERAACPFSVVVFGSDLKDVGDVRRLEGRVIEIHGPVKLYDGRAEIILKRVSQLTGGSTLIPPMPKNYDVEKQGHYSAGRMRPSKKPAKTYATPAATATYGNEADVSGEPPQ